MRFVGWQRERDKQPDRDSPEESRDARNGDRRFRRADGAPLAVAGLWNEWTDPATGEVIPSYTMLTINCNAHPVLRHMHRPDLGPDKQPLPEHLQDKRTIVSLERDSWGAWLHGTREEAAALIHLPEADLYAHGATDSEHHFKLPA